MSAERFLDEVARTLAEPMPRRRAVRVIGASLAALAVPGLSPAARATVTAPSQKPAPPCPPGSMCCRRTPYDPKGQIEQKICGYPRQRYGCGRDGFTCTDTCPPFNAAIKSRQKATWSSERYPDGSPKRYNCCPVPQFEPVNGECLPNCRLSHGPGAHRCKDGCCPRTQRCVRSTGACKGCPQDRPVVCGPECCDRVDEECLDVYSERSSNARRRQCVEKCGPGKRRCIASDGQLGECCPSGFPCCGASCGCDGRQECVAVSLESGVKKMCLPKCRAPQKRCHRGCCAPDRMYRDRYPDGRSYCRCRAS